MQSARWRMLMWNSGVSYFIINQFNNFRWQSASCKIVLFTEQRGSWQRGGPTNAFTYIILLCSIIIVETKSKAACNNRLVIVRKVRYIQK